MTDKSKFVDAEDQQNATKTPGVQVTVPRMSTWLYVQATGDLFRPDGSFRSNGYSGNGDGLNNPAMQDVPNDGPIPCGVYDMGKVDEEKGPFTIHLNPRLGNLMFRRSGFLIHGDNHEQNHTASHGCIIMDRITRVELSGEAERGACLRVIAKQAQAVS